MGTLTRLRARQTVAPPRAASMAVGEPGWLPPDEHCTAVGDAAAAALNADALAAQAPTLEDGSNGPPTCTVDHGGDPDTGALPGAATG